MNLLVPGQPGALEEGRPVHARRVGCEVLHGPGVVALQDVGRIFARGVRLGDLRLQRKHLGRARFAVGVAGQLEHGGDVLLVLGAQVRHLRAVGQVVGAVGHAQAALQQVRHVARRVGQALGNPQAEHVFGEEVGVVERVDVGAQRGAQRARQRRLVLDGVDLRQHRLERRGALRFDRRFVHEGLVEVGDLARFGRRLLVGVDGVEHLDDALVGVFGDRGEGAPAAAVGRDLGLGQPVAVGVVEEVVARQHGHGGRLGSGRRRGGGLRVRRRESERGAAQGEADGGLDWGPAGVHGVLFLFDNARGLF